MMARAKIIYILIVKVNKLFSFFFVAVFSKRNRKHVFRVSTRESLNSKKLWKVFAVFISFKTSYVAAIKRTSAYEDTISFTELIIRDTA